jgi:hypothetical protein
MMDTEPFYDLLLRIIASGVVGCCDVFGLSVIIRDCLIEL